MANTQPHRAWNDYAKNEGLVTPAMRDGPQRRAKILVHERVPLLEKAKWDVAPDPELLRELPDEAVWRFIVEAVRNCTILQNALVAQPRWCGKTWLSQQPLFRAQLSCATRRGLTFPNDVFCFIRDYITGEHRPQASTAPPWRDPELAAEQADVMQQAAVILGNPGRRLRRLDLSD